MKTKLILIFAVIAFSSCSKNEDSCLRERLSIIEKYDKSIDAAPPNSEKQKTLIRNKEQQLAKVICN